MTANSFLPDLVFELIEHADHPNYSEMEYPPLPRLASLRELPDYLDTVGN